MVVLVPEVVVVSGDSALHKGIVAKEREKRETVNR